MSASLVVIAHNIRSIYNVGSFFRTCDGFGVDHLYLSGYTPYPRQPKDSRLAHVAERATNQIHKTALGAEETVPFSHYESAEELISQLRNEGYMILALEQDQRSIALADFTTERPKLALLVGEEVHGLPGDLRESCDAMLEIPMIGTKESFNVSVALGIGLYELHTHLRAIHSSP